MREERWRERDPGPRPHWQPGGVVIWPFAGPPRRLRRGGDNDDD
jgi:hypothetical protein